MPKLPTKLSVWDFGTSLLETNDLDPIYCMLWEAKLPRDVLLKWLLSYWCHYHSGTASWTVDQPNFWEALMTVAESKDYPRCMERRHFRGQNAIKSVMYLQKQSVEERLSPITNSTEIPANDLMKYVQQWVGFGPWIAFKAADMIDRLGLAKVNFNIGNITLFDSPREGAELMYLMYGSGPKPVDVVSWAVKQLVTFFQESLAPPRYERPVNIQEAETILCKWKSHYNGHYYPGEDIESLKKTLTHYKDSSTSTRLLTTYNTLWPKDSHA